MFSLMMQSRKGHQLKAVPVSRKGEGNRISFVTAAHELGRCRDDLVHVRCAGVTDLGAADDHALTWLSVDTDAVHICLDHM